MDHPCHHCNQPVEDGVPFCAHCGAPQIRVIMPEATPAPAPAGEVSAITPEYSLAAGAGSPLSNERAQALLACLLAGFIAALAISLRIVEGIGMLSGGVLAVVFYRRRQPGLGVRALGGALLGAISGVFAFLFSVALDFLVGVVIQKTDVVREQALEMVKQMPQFSSDPQLLAKLNYWKTPEGATSLILFFLFSQLFAFLIFSGLGGLLGAVVFRRRTRR